MLNYQRVYPTLTGSQLLLVESGSYYRLNSQIEKNSPTTLDHLQQEMVER